MIDTVIIDDEQAAQITLMRFLQMHCPNVNIVGTADGVEEGLKLLESKKADLVFLDIKMNDGTGFDLLKRLPEMNFKLVFTTAYDEYALKAFKYSAIDYLLKPIDPLELIDAVGKVEPKSTKKTNTAQSVDSMFELYKENKFDKIAIPSVDEFHFVRISEIIRCEASSNYTIIYLSTGKKIVAPKTLKEFEELLVSEGFFRVHQSHLINLSHIQQFMKTKNKIRMVDASEVEVSRRKKTLFMELINMRKL
ncbi:LytR/AlgR family response regulator transcription factor [Aureispira anguillae]|uniref:LytTR family DNA-binding domain-containing protein n=1 Tax=Aureispira anguillae TaxID=2864201 RepID=A0A915VKJ6_9BACT|nr:LytTR family DNA-binding domain-containing protein [Aureispira anguillae]BDS09742.1 LytTR family DNA-binding domain-containing protein [Aureispira anguillae]